MNDDLHETPMEQDRVVPPKETAPLTPRDLDQWEREIVEYCRQTLDELRQLAAGACSGTFHAAGGMAGVGSLN